jgi:hypothetical protein
MFIPGRDPNGGSDETESDSRRLLLEDLERLLVPLPPLKREGTEGIAS